MKVVIEVPDSLVERIRLAVESGEYDDVREFVSNALEHQLEREATEQNKVKTLQEAVASGEAVQTPATSSESGEVEIADDSSNEDNASSPSRAVNQSIALTERHQYDNLETVQSPDSDRLDAGPLWGQYNRLFPVKLVVRCLVNELLRADRDTSSGWINLPPFAKQVAETARTVGHHIADFDEQFGRKRGEKLATGLPIGEDSEKSLDRFQTHFIGRAEHGGELTGAPPHLLLTNMIQEERGQIGVTDAGRKFASLRNPLLDRGFDEDRSLSPEECRFYVTHVREARPEEFEAMQKVAQAIEEGDNRPDALTARVAYLDPTWSNSQAKTIRAGLTSRMYELGLVERRRVGQRGTAYELTAEGDALLSEEQVSESSENQS